MHGSLNKDREIDGARLFFSNVRNSAESVPSPPRSTYGSGGSPNWAVILVILIVHVVAFYALVKFDVIHIAPKPKALVVDLIAEPPTPPAEKSKPEPVVVEKVQPQIVTPAPIVQTLASPPPITVTTTPPPPKPVAVQAPPPAGPVTVGNLDETLLDGRPPRYPMESRRKKEQGTVVLRLLIGTDGRVHDISIAQSSGFERLDQAALTAIRGWRWRPTIRNGEPVEVRGLYSMPFTLQA